ncbi:Trm112p-domain-containing protein [Rozella allomycis CSF55]|uniref:Trm112p-domain-containing protein n=1 Tax=Rozella allomycis (strain CSF55) TaxID=988480 RepID=A0A075B3Z2_ROZAC|nr:hypothetical protein O9G_004365 [Rozella allomycis CSF55]RKP21463.1 Trm112p-domain-containing protein [Rozella allomycis CSF55]|eukprot:EPZ35708.1 hypothetical protein O9G_004365 [Rozella allomycis CSF55]
MRLLTHNLLQCHVKKCTTNNFPLNFAKVMTVEDREVEFHPQFIERMIPRLDFDALKAAMNQLNIMEEIPFDLNKEIESYTEDELKLLHGILMQKEIIDGEMVCKNCGHVYPIKDGIPNMLLEEDEVK